MGRIEKQSVNKSSFFEDSMPISEPLRVPRMNDNRSRSSARTQDDRHQIISASSMMDIQPEMADSEDIIAPYFGDSSIAIGLYD